MTLFTLVPQLGRLELVTEMGLIEVFPGEICVIPRGIVFSVKLPEQQGRGYICEVFDGFFKLPNLGPIGANGLANPRDFKYPGALLIYLLFSSPFLLLSSTLFLHIESTSVKFLFTISR